MCLNLLAQKKTTYDQYVENELLDYSLVIKYRDSIGLTGEQQQSLLSFHKDNDFDFKETVLQYDESISRLKQAVEQGDSDQSVMEIFSEVLAIEAAIKRNKLEFLLFTKNLLSDAQRKQLRLIGRSNQLNRNTPDDGYFLEYFSRSTPLYKLVLEDKSEIFLERSSLGKLDFSKISTIEVDKGVDVTIDGMKLTNQNMITIRLDEESEENDTKVRFRGKNSRVSSQFQPMIILKHKGKTKTFAGTDYKKAVGDLNPDDISSIEVIKGDKAAAGYGAQATGGVIIITLKDKSKYKIE